ncbi:hypothetical protein MASR1M68_08280 [Elusimicrobiota bacterium]
MAYVVDEELKAKYGRNNSSKSGDVQQSPEKTKPSNSKQETNPAGDNLSVNLQQESAEKLIEQEIAENYSRNEKIKDKKSETSAVKFLKIIVYIAIIATVLSIVVALVAKTSVNTESEEIIEQIKKAEDLYFDATNRYYYFSRTSYNDTLGVDLSRRKYFMSYEVVPNIEFGNYEIKLYGATNAFTITYYVIKSLIFNKK